MDSTNVCHQGTIKSVNENTLFVEIERHAACSGCNAKGACMAFSNKNELLQVHTNNPQEFKVGECVLLVLKKSIGAKAVVIGYLCPFLVLIIGLFVTYYFSKNELLSIGVAFAATTLYYIFLKKIDNKLQKHFSFSVNKMEG